MDILPLLATASGAIIALSGTLLADLRRDRRQRERNDEQIRQQTYVEFALALNAAHGALREVSEVVTEAGDRRVAVNRAVQDADVYGARERLFISATAALVGLGEIAFLRLIAIRTAIRQGATIGSTEYHDLYHSFAEALWHFRLAVRADFARPAFTADNVGQTSWSERESCAVCAERAT